MSIQFNPLQLLADEATRSQVSDHGRALVQQCAQQIQAELAQIEQLRAALEKENAAKNADPAES